MERIEKITDEYGNIISEAVPDVEDPPHAEESIRRAGQSRKKTDPAVKPKHAIINGKKVEIKKTVITSEMQFQQFQQNKGKLTMLMIDHEKLGIERKEVLEALKEWFFFVRSGQDVDSDDEGDGQSYITSLADVLKDTRGAAKLVEETTLRSNEKLGALFTGIKNVYHESVALQQDTTKKLLEEDVTASFEKELRDAEFELDRVQEMWKTERSALKQKLARSEEKIAASIKVVSVEKNEVRVCEGGKTRQGVRSGATERYEFHSYSLSGRRRRQHRSNLTNISTFVTRFAHSSKSSSLSSRLSASSSRPST